MENHTAKNDLNMPVNLHTLPDPVYFAAGPWLNWKARHSGVEHIKTQHVVIDWSNQYCRVVAIRHHYLQYKRHDHNSRKQGKRAHIHGMQ